MNTRGLTRIKGPSWSQLHGTYVVGFTTTYAISAYQYHHWSCEFEPHSWRGILNTTLCNKVCQLLATGRWFSQCTDHHDITEILWKVALITINQTKQEQYCIYHICEYLVYNSERVNVKIVKNKRERLLSLIGIMHKNFTRFAQSKLKLSYKMLKSTFFLSWTKSHNSGAAYEEIFKINQLNLSLLCRYLNNDPKNEKSWKIQLQECMYFVLTKLN